MELGQSLCKCNKGIVYVDSCCFNPIIYFVCKLCLGTFENVEKLLLHKRQEHTVSQLKDIKFIIFEETLVEADDNKFQNALLGAQDTAVDINSEQDLNQAENPDITAITDIPVKTEEVELQNPYVSLRRLSWQEIWSYSRTKSLQNQKSEDGNEITAATRSDIKSIESSSLSCSTFADSVPATASLINLTTQEEIDVLSAKRSKLSNTKINSSNSNPQISSAVVYDVNPAKEFQSENNEQELADGEFIVANVVQSLDGIGKVQFLSTSNPVTAVTDPVVSTVDSEVIKNTAIAERYHNALVKTETDCDMVHCDVAPPSPVPSLVPSSADEPNPNTNYSNEAQVSIDIGTSRIRASTPTETVSQDGPAPNTRAGARTLRNRSKLNYSENQTCAKCSRDFYTVEDLEEHEKVCLRKKTNREQFRKRNLAALITIAAGTQAPQDFNGNIQVVEAITIFPNRNDLDVKVTDDDRDQDQDYDRPDLSSGYSELDERVGIAYKCITNYSNVQTNVGSDSENKANNCSTSTRKLWSTKQRKLKTGSKSCTIQRSIPIRYDSAKYDDCPLSIKEWLKKERYTNPENIICLDPEPFQDETENDTEAEATAFIVTPENPLKCKLCSNILTSDVLAKRHLFHCWLHNKKNHLYCPACPKQLKDPSEMRDHNRVKHPKSDDVPVPVQRNSSIKMKCTVCSKELTTNRVNFKKHMEIHEKPNEKNFACEICGWRSNWKHSYHRHLLIHSKDRFKCNWCPMKFKKMDLLSQHKALHAKNKDYHCSTCSKAFSSKNQLANHTRFHFKERWMSCKAENCDFKYTYKASLLQHCKKVHKELFSQMAKFSCTVCNKEFVLSGKLKRHMLSHSGVKPFKCSAEGCNRAYAGRYNLIEHSRKHTGERPYQCDTCGSTFWKLSSFHKHLKAHNNPPDQVLCHLCPRKFPHNYELQQHLIFHEKGKQFQCDICGFKCMTKANLKGHMKTHKRMGKTQIEGSSDSETQELESDSEKELEMSTLETRASTKRHS